MTPSRSRRSGRSGSALACTETLQESGDGVSGLSHTTHMADFDDSTIAAVPKKPRTGVLLPAPAVSHIPYCSGTVAGTTVRMRDLLLCLIHAVSQTTRYAECKTADGSPSLDL